jgi:N-succinyldiaminopimelate aminotransferase
MMAGENQYPPARGRPELRAAVAAHQEHHYGLAYDPEHEVLITIGATGGVSSALLALCEPGDEVITLDPTYDVYPAVIALGGAVHRPVPLHPPEWRLDPAELEAAVTPRSRILLINTPHNPTGRVLDDHDLEAIADVARRHDLLVVTDEVYEHLVFDGHRHRSPATLPGMRERTLVLSSAGKTFAVTGWKVGWACGPAPVVRAVEAASQFLTFTGGAPFQPAVAQILGEVDAIAPITADLGHKRRLLTEALTAAGLQPLPSQGTYFLTADIRALGEHDGLAFCRDLPRRCGVVAIPSGVFFADPDRGRHFVRFAFCASEEAIGEGADRLLRLSA